MTTEHNIAQEELTAIDDEVQRLIDDSVTAARSAPDPMPEDLLTDVYIKY